MNAMKGKFRRRITMTSWDMAWITFLMKANLPLLEPIIEDHLLGEMVPNTSL